MLEEAISRHGAIASDCMVKIITPTSPIAGVYVGLIVLIPVNVP